MNEPADECAAVMVCGGSRCARRTDATLDTLKPLIRRAPRSVLMRTGCPAVDEAACGGQDPTVVLQRCDARMRPRVRPRVVEFDDLCDLRRQVARWLLSEESQAR